MQIVTAPLQQVSVSWVLRDGRIKVYPCHRVQHTQEPSLRNVHECRVGEMMIFAFIHEYKLCNEKQ